MRGWIYDYSMIRTVTAICSKLDFKETKRVTEKAKEILNNAEKAGITKGKPISAVSAAIYIAAILCDDKRTQQEITNAGGSSTAIIRKRYSNFTENMQIELIV